MESATSIQMHIADLASKYGHKGANLTFLNEKLEEIKEQTGINVVIPKFTTLDTKTVMSFISERHQKKFKDLWQALHNSIAGKTELNQEAKDKINELTTFFTSSLMHNTALNEGAISKIFDTLGINIEDKSKDYIIRSTGVEDSWEITNPGGNLSVPYIYKNPMYPYVTFRYIIAVFASYFSESSISARLAAGDKPNSDLFIPVVVQEMIPSHTGTNYARSGVAIINSECFGKNTIKISSTFGHNEGVTSGTVLADETFITPSGIVYNGVKRKNQTYQTVPCKHWYDDINKQKLVSLDKSISDTASIPEDLAKKLKKIFDKLSVLYGSEDNPACLDIEFTVTNYAQADEQINILQVRPFLEKKNIESNYVDFDYINNLNNESKISIHCITGMYVTEVTRQNEILFAPSIIYAKEKFQKLTKSDRLKIKAVIVNDPNGGDQNKSSKSLSHEVIELMSTGLPVVMVSSDDSIKLQELLNAGRKIIIDPQNTVMLVTDEKIPTIKGKISHPASGFLDTRNPDINDVNIDTKINEMISSLQEFQSDILDEAIDEKSLRKEITLLKAQFDKESINRIKNKLFLILKKCQGRSVETKIITYNVCSKILEVIKNLEDSYKSNADKEEKLLHIQYLDKLLYGKNNQYFAGFDSLKTIEEKIQNEEKWGSGLINTSAVHLFTESLTDQWSIFVKSISEDKDTQKKLSYILNALGDLQINESLNFFLLEEGDPVAKVNKWHDDISNETVLQLKEQLGKIEIFKINVLDKFKTLRGCEMHASSLDNLITETFQSLRGNLMPKSSSLVKFLQINIVQKLVECCDLAIKNFKSSPEFVSPEKRFRAFKVMVSKFYNIYKMLTFESATGPRGVGCSDFNIKKLDLPVHYLRDEQIEGIIKTFDTKTKQSMPEEYNEFDARQNFDPLYHTPFSGITSSEAINAIESDDQAYPQTLEEFFMVFHQSCLQVVNALKAKNLSIDKVFPENLQELVNGILKIKEEGDNKFTLDTIDIQNGNINLIINHHSVAKNNHFCGFSSIFVINYDLKKNAAKITIKGSEIRELRAENILKVFQNRGYTPTMGPKITSPLLKDLNGNSYAIGVEIKNLTGISDLLGELKKAWDAKECIKNESPVPEISSNIVPENPTMGPKITSPLLKDLYGNSYAMGVEINNLTGISDLLVDLKKDWDAKECIKNESPVPEISSNIVPEKKKQSRIRKIFGNIGRAITYPFRCCIGKKKKKKESLNLSSIRPDNVAGK